ncbi:PfkB family carbohydrate kinase [Rhizobium mongolense]|uniref:PfkB family carbohydrate kinase n=1 Tax=Rhizobium mongolense TaxID=57676 RepID=UPI0034A326A8
MTGRSGPIGRRVSSRNWLRHIPSDLKGSPYVGLRDARPPEEVEFVPARHTAVCKCGIGASRRCAVHWQPVWPCRPWVSSKSGYSATRSKSVVVTAGGAGVAFANRQGDEILIEAVKVDVKSTHGAGDEFIGAGSRVVAKDDWGELEKGNSSAMTSRIVVCSTSNGAGKSRFMANGLLRSSIFGGLVRSYTRHR